MSAEFTPSPAERSAFEPEQPEDIFRPDGSLDEAFIEREFGLGVEEANQIVRYKNYEGTLAQVLNDKDCPVRAMLRDAYEQNGIDGVNAAFGAINTLSLGKTNLQVTETTRAREGQKKN